MWLRQRSSRSSTLWRNRARASNSSNEALTLMVCAARNKEEISSRSSGWVSNARSDCSICARHSSVSSRNDCNSISRLISIIPLQNPDYRIAYVCAEHDALPPVHAHSSGNHGDLRFRKDFQSDFNVAASNVLLLVRIRFAQGIEQTASAKHFCAKLCATCACFEKLLQQYGNGDAAIARGRHASSIPTGQHVVGGAADGVNGIPDANADARTENESNGFPFCRNENLTSMEKMRIRRTEFVRLGGQRGRENGR